MTVCIRPIPLSCTGPESPVGSGHVYMCVYFAIKLRNPIFSSLSLSFFVWVKSMFFSHEVLKRNVEGIISTLRFLFFFLFYRQYKLYFDYHVFFTIIIYHLLFIFSHKDTHQLPELAYGLACRGGKRKIMRQFNRKIKRLGKRKKRNGKKKER